LAGTASSNTNPSNVQGACPTGWHLPSDDEWKQLEMYLGMSQIEADATEWRGTVEGVKLRIGDVDPLTGEGEIQAQGENVMKGYYKDQQRTKEVLSEDGWFKTGDLGILKKDRYLYIKGRLKNVIVGPSGENIYPEEIEALIVENEYALESVVYSQENRITARIHLNYELLDEHYRNSKTNDSQMEKIISDLLDEIRKETNDQLAQFSRINKVIEQTEPFEKTPTKKIKRYLYTI